MEVLIVAVDEVESQPRASQQPPTHLLLDFLPTWPIPLESAYLNSRALVKPGYYYTSVVEHLLRSSWSILQREGLPLSLSLSFSPSLFLSEAKRKFYETRAEPRAIGSLTGYAGKCDYYLQLGYFKSQGTLGYRSTTRIFGIPRCFAIRRNLKFRSLSDF